MKRCPECRRDYFDDSLAYCLDDGSALLEGPSSGSSRQAEPQTMLLTDGIARLEYETEIVRAGTAAITPSNNSIAVLPFANITADEENEYFCEGLAEELLNALARIENLKVAARTSAFSFKGKNAEARGIGKVLNVDTVLEGSVRKAGDRVRINVRLVNAVDGYQMWSERYDRQLKDIFEIQDEITLAVVDALKLKLLGSRRAAVLKHYTANPAAYQLYLKGQFHHGKYSETGWRKAIEYFEQCLALEPEYAPAYAGTAAAGVSLLYYGHDTGPQAVGNIQTATARALDIDPDLAEAHRSKALIELFVDWNFPAAERSFRLALDLNPNDAIAHAFYGFWLIATEQPDRAVIAALRARELDPLSVRSGLIVGWTLWFAHRYEESLTIARDLLEIDPEIGHSFRLLGMSYWALNDLAEAEDALKTALEKGAASIALTGLCGVYAQAGKSAEARQCLDQVRSLREQGRASALVVAYAYALTGETDEAFVWLERALAERNGELVFARVLPEWFLPLVEDPRYEALLRQVGSPE